MRYCHSVSWIVACLASVLGGLAAAAEIDRAAEDEVVAEEVRSALAQLAVREGKPEPVLVAALTDASAARRAGAGSALARATVSEQQGAVHKLLLDPEPLVRLHVGLALAARK